MQVNEAPHIATTLCAALPKPPECVKNGETKNTEKLASKDEQKRVAANRFGGGEAAPKMEVQSLSGTVAAG